MLKGKCLRHQRRASGFKALGLEFRTAGAGLGFTGFTGFRVEWGMESGLHSRGN